MRPGLSADMAPPSLGPVARCVASFSFCSQFAVGHPCLGSARPSRSQYPVQCRSPTTQLKNVFTSWLNVQHPVCAVVLLRVSLPKPTQTKTNPNQNNPPKPAQTQPKRKTNPTSYPSSSTVMHAFQ